ncbi:MAG: ergothioneine biosynthesis protein EgtB [Myxococcota bacterium]
MSELAKRFQDVRARSGALCASLTAEDHMLQAMPDVSPAKWHLAHTTWFFETFLLEPLDDYAVFHPKFRTLFNSYYQAVGPQYPRPRRGLLSRPPLSAILEYRRYVDTHILALIEAMSADDPRQAILTLGLHHEQQHQELLATDIKYNLSINPLQPAWQEAAPESPPAPPPRWIRMPGGLVEVGFDADGFCFDNETPRHTVWLEPYQVRSTLITNAEYREFIEDGGYDDHRLWLSDGWAWRQAHNVQAPLYWQHREADGWSEYTLYGRRPLDPNAPVTHLSAYEADAFAAWAGARLITEPEWEVAAPTAPAAPIDRLAAEMMHPRAPDADADAEGALQMFGEVWQWTRSAYLPYPGYEPLPGALGEYNGKFMCGQWVLRGSACVTPPGHTRRTYRNFFYPHQRWQFTGIRLARG